MGAVYAVPEAAEAQTLGVLLDMARRSEPSYLGAQATVDSATAKHRQALGSFLPQINLSASAQSNQREYETLNDLTPMQSDRYQSRSVQLSLNLPLFRYADHVNREQTGYVLEQSLRQLEGVGQELSVKVLAAWFDLLAARDQQSFAAAQEKAARKAWLIANRGHELGLVGAPQKEETRAKLDQALADQAGAEADAGARLAALEQLTGTLPSAVFPYLRIDRAVSEDNGIAMAEWQKLAEEHNPAWRAAQQAYDAATAEVDKQYAGHAPTLDLVTQVSRNRQNAGGFPGQAGYNITQESIGLQLNVPIYSGGIQSAKVDDAMAQQSKARADREAARRAAIFAIRQAWAGAQSARFRLSAGRQAIESTTQALRMATVGEKTGLKSDLDVLSAEQQWLAARRDWGRAWYDLMLARARLKSAAGMLNDADFAEIEARFQDNLPEGQTSTGDPMKTQQAAGI